MKNLKKSIFGQYQYNFYYHIPLELQAVPVLFPPLELQAVPVLFPPLELQAVSKKINKKYNLKHSTYLRCERIVRKTYTMYH